MLITADWHIRRHDRIWYRRDNIFGDTANSIEQIVQIANEYAVEYVLLLGDLFDLKLQQSDALQVMRLALDHFEHNGQQVMYVQGQHERSEPPLLAALHSWPEYIHNKLVRIEEIDANIFGLDYCNPINVEAALGAIPEEADILATHQVWRDFLGADRGDAWFGWAKPVRYIFTGDLHQTINEQRGDKYIVSPGSICMQDIGETPDKFVHILYDDMSVRAVKLKTRQLFEQRIHNEDELDAFMANWQANPARIPRADVHRNIATNLLRVHVAADLKDARQRIEATIGSDVHLFFDRIPVDVQQMSADAELRTRVVLDGGLEGCINAFYADDPAVRADAVRLARTRDIQTELIEIYKERINDGINSDGEGLLPEEAE